MEEWEAMVLPRTAASYYLQRGAVSVSGVAGTQLGSPMSAHGTVNASAGILKSEAPNASAELSPEEPVRRKRGRPWKRELSQGEPDASAGVSKGESVKRKRGRPRKRELSQEEPDASAGVSSKEPNADADAKLSQGEPVRKKPVGRPRKRKLELSEEELELELEASAGVSQEEPNASVRLSEGESDDDASDEVLEEEEPKAPQPIKRKRGRPRKCGPDGHPNQNLPVQSNLGGNSVESEYQPDSSSPISAHGVNDSAGLSQGEPRRKRGRPRKSGSDGKRRPGRPRKSGIDCTVVSNSAGSAFQLNLSSPILAHGVNASASEPVRRRRGRPRKKGLSSISSPPPPSHGEWLSGSAGMGLTPDIITIAVGEDIVKKVMSFLQQGPRVVCILSANGAVSTVTLRQPSTSSDTVKYEGHYEILWLSGSYMLTGTDGSCSRTGGLSVSLCSHDGQVICGAVDEMLVAATPVQVIVGSFMCSGSKAKQPVIVTISESSADSESSVDGDKSVTSTNHSSGDKSVTPTDHPSGDKSDKSVAPTDHPSGDKSVPPTDYPSGDESVPSVAPTDHPSGDKSVPPTDHPSGDESVPSVAPTDHPSGDKSVPPTDHPSGDELVPPTDHPSSNQNLRE